MPLLAMSPASLLPPALAGMAKGRMMPDKFEPGARDYTAADMVPPPYVAHEDYVYHTTPNPFDPPPSPYRQQSFSFALVEHPSHYTAGGIETIDFIDAKQLGYHLGNVVKYVSRAGKKEGASYLADLQKAQWYLQRAISRAMSGQDLAPADSANK